MPLCYGGGVQTLDDANRLIAGGVEKVALNTASFESPGLISEIASRYGSQSVVVGIDVKKNWLNSYRVLNSSRSNLTSHNPIAWAKRMADAGGRGNFVK
jgi:cyclase